MNTVVLKRPRDFVYETMKRRIMMNELMPGSVLTELGIARELGCSQGTIREVRFQLQEDGLVTRAGHRGTMVTRLDAEEAQEILALRRRIEVRGALRAAQNVQDADLRRLSATLADMEAAARAEDPFGVMELDMVFHLALFRLARLEAMEQILTRCTLHTHRSRVWAPGHRRPLVQTARRHEVLLESLAARDGERLSAALGEHIDTIVAETAE
jgi:DNA-binding GntR family transcriptional regulator